jgi:hypothetical protein
MTADSVAEEEKEKYEKLGFTFIKPPSKATYYKNQWQVKPAWRTIEIESLEDLIEFIKNYGTAILTMDVNDPEIEIYNDYRE